MCAETKCKLEVTPFDETTLRNVLVHARKQNLPSSRPGMICAKLPQKWIENEAGYQRVVKVTNQFLKNARRIVSVKYYTSFVGEVRDTGQVGETLGWHEIPNPNNQFDTSTDWQLFPGLSEVVRTWNGRPPHWKPIIKEWPVKP